MRATGFAADTLTLDWSAPQMTVEAWRLGGQSDRLEFLPAGENNYWVRARGRKHIYQVYDSAFKTFNKDPSELRAVTAES